MCISGINIFHSLQNTSICGCQEDFRRADVYGFPLLLSSPKQQVMTETKILKDSSQYFFNKGYAVNTAFINR